MLILTRRTNESIIITDNNNAVLAQIVVTDIDKNQTKLGICAPAGNKVYRKELHEKIFKNEQPGI